MNTKFIIHGGFNKNKTDENNQLFYSEILRDVSDGAHILLVPFAKDEDRIIPATEKISKEFQSVSEGKTLHINIATRDNFYRNSIPFPVLSDFILKTWKSFSIPPHKQNSLLVIAKNTF
jgi:hypothetical protein